MMEKSDPLPVADIDPDDAFADRDSHERKDSTNWIQVLTGLFVVGVLVSILAICVIKQRKKAEMTTSTSNFKSLFYLAVEFDQDFGAFPGDEAAIDELALCRGDYSNDYFAQFILGGYTTSEEVFYAKGGGSVDRKPDNVVSPPSRILEAGECGYALIIGSSTRDTSGAPIILSPMGQSGLTFRPEPYDRKAIALRIDGSVKQYSLDPENRAVIGGGKTLFDGGKGTVWGESGFDLKRLKHAK